MKTTLRLIAAACLYVTTAFAQNQLTANLTVTNQEIVGAAAGSIPVTVFEVDSTSTSSPRGIMSAQFNSGTDGARFHGRKARGTRAAPTTVVTGDNLTRWVGSGYDGSNFLEDASIIFGTEGTVAATRIPTNIQFWTATDAAPSVLTEAARFDSAQRLRFGGSSGGYISGTSGAISLTGAGTNQSITLTPSGTGGLLVPVSGGTVQGLTINATAGSSQPMLALKDYAGTPNEWRFYLGANSVNDGALVLRDQTRSAIRAVFATTGNLLLGGLASDGTGLVQFPAGTSASGGITFGVDWALYRTTTGRGSLDAPGQTTVRLDLATSGTTRGSLVADNGNNVYIVSGSATALTLDGSQNATFVNNITTGFNMTISNLGAGSYNFKNSTSISAPSDGILEITNAAGSSFTRLQLGGTTSSFPSIKRSSATLAFRLADDSADAAITSGAITSTGTIDTTGVVTAQAGSNGAPGFAIHGDPDTGMYSPNTNQLGFATGGGTTMTFDSSQNTQISKLVTSYNGIATAGNGVVTVQGAARATAQTGANASVATYTVGASDASFEVSANILVTTATTHAFTCTCAYTDEGNTARTITFTFSNVGGTFLTSIANTGGTVPYEGVPLHIRAKASTTITIATTGTFTSVVYNVEGVIRKLQ